MTAGATTRRQQIAVLAGAAALALVGCVADEPSPTPSAPATSEAPAEPSDEELLEEARDVYEGYLAEAGAMYEAGDRDYTRLEPWATLEMATGETAAIANFVDNGISVTSWYSLVSLFDVSATRSPSDFAVGACVDVSAVTLTDATGADVTPPDRATLVHLNLRFRISQANELLLHAQEPWADQEPSPCA